MVNNESFSLIYFGISWTSKRMELVPLLYLPMPPLFMILIYIDEYLLKLVQKSTLGIVFIYPHVIIVSMDSLISVSNLGTASRINLRVHNATTTRMFDKQIDPSR